MTLEAMQSFGWKSAGIALKLRNHPAEVQTLKLFRQAAQEIPLFNVRIVTIDSAWLDSAAAISQQTGLLHNDALIIAAMKVHGLLSRPDQTLPRFGRSARMTVLPRTG